MRASLKLIGLFMSLLVISLPVCFADELNLVYDENGNLLSGDDYNRTYNSFNQLTKIYNETGTLLEEFTYHPLDERVLVKKIYNSSESVVETVYYIDENFVRVVNDSGSYDYTYVKHNGQLVAQLNPDSSKYFIHGDHLGSSTVVTNESGDVIENTTYSPFGTMAEKSDLRYSYTGQEFDSVVNDYDFHARKYKAEWGLFLQPDTLISNVYNPQALNHYMFELGNPYKYTDEDGHEPITLLAIGAVLLTSALVGAVTGMVTSYYYQKQVHGKVDASRVWASAGIGAGLGILGAGALLGIGALAGAGVTYAIGSSAGGAAISLGAEATVGVGTSLGLEYWMDDKKDKEAKAPDAVPSINPNINSMIIQANSQMVASQKTVTPNQASGGISYDSSGGYFRGSSGGRTRITFRRSGGRITGGSIGRIRMSSGFARKAAAALSSLSSS